VDQLLVGEGYLGKGTGRCEVKYECLVCGTDIGWRERYLWGEGTGVCEVTS
jgi:hypothetical protein